MHTRARGHTRCVVYICRPIFEISTDLYLPLYDSYIICNMFPNANLYAHFGLYAALMYTHISLPHFIRALIIIIGVVLILFRQISNDKPAGNDVGQSKEYAHKEKFK